MLIAINGFFGQMGQKVFNEIIKSKDFEFAGGVDRLSGETLKNDLNKIAKESTSIFLPDDIKGKIFDNLFKIKDCEGVIDFSHPSALNNVLNFCLDRRVPLVLATTGLTDKDRQKVKFASRYIPIFMSSNLSLAVQVLSDLVLSTAKSLKGYDIEIVETHHCKKKDAPSGTALMLANKIAETNKQLTITSGTKLPPIQNKVCVHSLRGGGVVGEHEILFLGEYDAIKISHTAFSREVFARGALDAMKFLKTKTCGLYSMQDLVKF